MIKRTLLISTLIGLLFMASCTENKKTNEAENEKKTTGKSHDSVVSEHKSLNNTPEEVLAELKEGNLRFMEDRCINTEYKNHIQDTKDDQHPHSVILSCLDSRIPPEIVFDQGIGNVFVARVAGNVEDANILGSIEFATKIKGAKLIVVMGHNKCGAVKGAIENAELGNLTQLVEQIKPAIKADKNKPDFMDEVSKNNVKMTIDDILKGSSVIRDLIKENKLKIVGAYYDVTSGAVSFLN